MKKVLPFICASSWPLAEKWKQALQDIMPEEQIFLFDELDPKYYDNCEVAIVANPDPQNLKKLPNLKWVHSVWAGVERLIEDSKKHKNLQIVRLVDSQLSKTMSEAVLAWTLYLHRDIPKYAKQQTQEIWLPHEYTPPEEKTVSLLGLGELGTAAAIKLVDNGFNVCGWSRTSKKIPRLECYTGEDGLKEMLTRTDIAISMLPLTHETKGFINKNFFLTLKKNASFINFSRGAIVDDSALREALNNDYLNHAILDVFHEEPLSASSWHWHHEKVTVLPHISAPTNRKTASAIVAENIEKYRKNGTIPESVDLIKGY